jgi:hypothetical protein
MPLIRPRLTEFHGLDLAQANVDFAIPFLNEDLPLYVDPFLLWNIQAGVPGMNEQEVEEFRKMAAQLDALHQETTAASKKHPDKPVSKFKVNLANSVLQIARKALGTSAPALDFEQFDIDDLPTNSDLSFVVTQFVECAEKLKAQNIRRYNGMWYWEISDASTDIVATAPKGVR